MKTLEGLQIRITGAKESANRTRFSLMVCVILSLCIIISAWNADVSWHRGFLVNSEIATNIHPSIVGRPGNDPIPAAIPRVLPPAEQSVTHLAQKRLIEEYVSSMNFTAPILGIRINSADIAPLGAASMLICSLWLVFCSRRENHVVGLLLIDSMEAPLEERKVVLHGVLSAMVFLTLGSDNPIRTLNRANEQKAMRFRWLVKALFYLPAAAPVCPIAADVWSLFTPAPFRAYNPVLWKMFGAKDWFDVVKWDVVTLFVCFVIWSFCNKAAGFAKATQTVLRSYSEAIDAETQPRQTPEQRNG